MDVQIYHAYTRGHRRMGLGIVHQDHGRMSVVRLEGRYGTVPVLELNGLEKLRHLYEPRIMDMIGDHLIVSGFEKDPDGAWVCQEWWLTEWQR